MSSTQPVESSAVDPRDPALHAATGRRERTRQRILGSAFRLIGHEQGLGVRIEEICAEANISRGSFYNYFAGMEDLFAALSSSMTHDFVAEVHGEMMRMERYAERCDASLRYYLQRARADTAWGWAMVHIGAVGPLFGAETAAMCESTISEGMARGEFRVHCARQGRDLVLGTSHAAILAHLREGSSEEMPRHVSRAVMRGLGVPRQTIERIVARDLWAW